MKQLGHNPSREDVLGFIHESSNFGNLGLFIGSGFCKAILNDDYEEVALSWGELLQKTAKTMGVPYKEQWIVKNGERNYVNFPEIADQICAEYADLNLITFEDAVHKLKETIAELTCWYPDGKQQKEFGEYLKSLEPAWIITTNYDSVIETLLTGRSISRGPNDQFFSAKGIVPVYHLHGHRLHSESITITQADYVSLFRPNNYRQIKIALKMLESTTLFLGYGLGDMNVLTALDWSSNVFCLSNKDIPNEVIQVVRKKDLEVDPYRDRSGFLIVETSGLVDFFNEYLSLKKKKDGEEEIENMRLSVFWSGIVDEHEEPDHTQIEKFINDPEYRQMILCALKENPRYPFPEFMAFFRKGLEEANKKTQKYGAFDAYAEELSLVLDILSLFSSIDEIPPALFVSTAEAFADLAEYIGPRTELGKAWDAFDLWEKRKCEIPKDIVKELKIYSKKYSGPSSRKLLKSL